MYTHIYTYTYTNILIKIALNNQAHKIERVVTGEGATSLFKHVNW